jgi:hypothetical protein
MTDKYLKMVLALVLAALTMKFTAFAQSPATSSVPSGAIQVLDGNKHVLGTLVGLWGTPGACCQQANTFIVFRKGYFVSLLFGGQFPDEPESGNIIYWSGPNCTGDAYLGAAGNLPMSRRLVIYSHLKNSFYVASGHGELAEAVAVQIQSAGIGNRCSGFNPRRQSSYRLSTRIIRRQEAMLGSQRRSFACEGVGYIQRVLSVVSVQV